MGGNLNGAVTGVKHSVAETVFARLAAQLGYDRFDDFVCRDVQQGGEIVCCGSVRRMLGTVNDVDVVIVDDNAHDKDFVLATIRLLGLPDDLALTKAKRPRKQINLLANPNGGVFMPGQGEGLQVDLYFCKPESKGAFMLFLTGSQQYNIWHRSIAKSRGYKLTQYGLWKGRGQLDASTEEAICEEIGIKFLPPRYRSAGYSDSWK